MANQQRKNNHGPNRVQEKPANFKEAFKRLFKSLNRYYFLISLAFIFAIFGSILAIVGPSKISTLTNIIIGSINTNINLDLIKKISLVLLIIYLLSAIFNYLQNYIMVVVANKYSKDLRSKLIKKINNLPLSYFDKHQKGDILSRMTNDIDTVGFMMQQSLGSLIGAISLVVGSIVMMFITNWIMAIASIISSLIGFVVMGNVLSKSQKYFNNRQKSLGKMNSHIEEIYSNHLVVVSYNGQDKALSKFDNLNNELYHNNQMSQFLSGLMGPFMAFIGNLGYVVVCITGSILVINNMVEFGSIVAFMIYIRLFINPLNQIAQGLTSFQTTLASSERVFEIFDEEEMVKENYKYIDPKTIKGNILFDHVKFGYDNKLVIKDFSIKIKNGKKIAIVGPTGAGKTTIVNLLMKFYDIKDGNILIDGINTKDMTRENIHDLFIMVLQDTWLFNGTIKENIIYNNKHVSDDMVWNALKNVGLDHFVKTLPNTIDYHITDNDTISQGQKQLLTIARGLIKNAPFLIFDEATSSVDTRTEELVQKAMDKLMEGRTSFIIAHRLSTIRNADVILVLKDGNIIEQGNHKDLLKQDGFYAKLYKSQFKI